MSAALTHPKAVSVSPTLGPFYNLVAIRGPPVEKGRIVSLSPLLVRTSTSASTTDLKPRERVAVDVGAIRNGISSDDRYSSSHSKTLRAALGFSFHSTGCVKRAKECWNESQTTNEKPGSKAGRIASIS